MSGKDQTVIVEPSLTELAMEWMGMVEAAVLVSRRRNELQGQLIAAMDAAGAGAVSVGDMVLTVETTGIQNEHRYLQKHKAAK